MLTEAKREFSTKQRLIRALAYLLIPGYLIMFILLFYSFSNLSDPAIYLYQVNSDLYHRTIPDNSFNQFAKIFVTISNEFTYNNINEKISLLPHFYCDDVPNSYYSEHKKLVKQVKERQTRQWVSDIRSNIVRKDSFADLTVSFDRYSTYSTSKPTKFRVKSKITIVALKDNMGRPRLCVRQNLKL